MGKLLRLVPACSTKHKTVDRNLDTMRARRAQSNKSIRGLAPWTWAQRDVIFNVFAVICVCALIFQSINISVCSTSRQSNTQKHAFLRFGEKNIPLPTCTDYQGLQCGAPTQSPRENTEDALYLCDGECSVHSTCYLGTCLCHPGYGGPLCDDRMHIANPWYTSDCPNLEASYTLDLNLSDVGGVKDCSGGDSFGLDLSYCAYLCYSNVEYGIAIIPHYIWETAQKAEGSTWKQSTGSSGDRYEDHFQGFADYRCLPASLGRVAEFGAGPWTQFRGLLGKRPDVEVESYTVIEPGADYYKANIHNCAYKTGKLEALSASGNATYHDFPVQIVSDLGESAAGGEYLFDTVLVVNVIEHVQNAVEFIHGIHKSIRPGGLLIYHDRYYDTPESGDAVLGRNLYHPIRLTRKFFDHFLSGFNILYNNCDGHNTIKGWQARNAGERGYYVIAEKKI